MKNIEEIEDFISEGKISIEGKEDLNEWYTRELGRKVAEEEIIDTILKEE